MSNRVKRCITLLIVFALNTMVALLLIGCASKTDKETFNVMFVDGDGYKVTSNQIVEVERGMTAEFNVELLDGYDLYYCNIGELSNGIFTVKDVMYSMTVIFDVRKVANIEIAHDNARVEISPIDGNHKNLFVGEKAKIDFIANENYNIGSLFINNEEIRLEKIDYRNATAEFMLDENMKICAKVLGAEYEFIVQNDSTRGSYEIVSSTIKDSVPRYGDVVTIAATPKGDKNSFGYFDCNGQKFFKNEPLTIKIKEKTIVKVQFYNEFEKKIIYNTNGGEFVGEPIEQVLYTTGNYENLNHCYNKMERSGYSLIGLQEGVNGEIHALGGMVKIPKTDLEMFAVWKKWTNEDYFKYSLNENNKYVIDGLSEKGLSANLIEIVIPEKYNSIEVIGVSSNAFKGNSQVRSVYFNKNTEIVGENAFSDCENLTNIMIFETMKSKANNAFENCPNFTTCEINATSDADNHDGFTSSLAYTWSRLKDKERGKKIITISGSSGSYGIDSQTVLKQMDGYEPLVFGLQRGFGITIMLNIISKYIRSDDIVVLTPEAYCTMYGIGEGRADFNYTYIQKNYDMMRDINVKEATILFASLSDFFVNNKNSGGIYYPITSGYLLDEYGALSTTRYCEYTSSYEPSIDKNLIAESGMSLIKKYAKRMILGGGKVYFSFSPIAKESLIAPANDERYRNEFQELLRENLRDVVTVISDVENYIMNSKYFCNSVNHLTTEGAILRTTQLVKDIKAQLIKEGVTA